MAQIALMKWAGIFGIILVVATILFGAVIGGIESYQTKTWNPILKSTGGKIFALDVSIGEEVDVLLGVKDLPSGLSNDESFKRMIVSDLFLNVLTFTFLGLLLFKLGNWISGIQQFSPGTDILIIGLIIALFAILEFIYATAILDINFIPLWDGYIKFWIKLPELFGLI